MIVMGVGFVRAVGVDMWRYVQQTTECSVSVFFFSC